MQREFQMRPSRLPWFVRLSVAVPLGLFLGCGGESGPEAQPANPAESSPAIVFRSDVVILDEQQVARTEEAPVKDARPVAMPAKPSGKLRLQAPKEALSGLRPGRVFIHGHRAFRAQALTETEDGLEVETAEPALEDVIEALDLSGEVALTPKHIQPQSLASSVRVASAPGTPMVQGEGANVVDLEDTGGALVFSLKDFVVVDLDGNPGTTWDRILANGNVTLDKPTLSFNVKWKFLKPPTAKLNFHAGESAHLSISTPAYGFSKTYEVPIAGFQVPIPGTMGAATIGGQLKLIFSASGQVQASIVFDQFATVDAGMVGEGFPWKVKPYATVDSGFSITPSIAGNLKLGAYLSPRLSLLVLQYDVAGVYAKLGIEATASGVVSPSQQCLTLDVNGKVGVNGYFRIPFYSVDKELYGHTWPIYNHQFCAE